MPYLHHFFLFFLDDNLYFIDLNAKETIETHKQRFPSINDKVWIENLALTRLHYTITHFTIFLLSPESRE